MESVTSDWLEETSAELQKQGIIDGKEKTSLAIDKWRKEKVIPISRDGKVDKASLLYYANLQYAKIKAYFLTQREKDRGFIYPPFVGVYFYHGSFWDVKVPLIMGRVVLNLFDKLEMPQEVRSLLYKDQDSVDEYVAVWADCFDYAYGIMEVESQCSSDFSKELFRSADKHLRATISLLNQEKASSKASEDSRMATEIFLKAYLSVKENLVDRDLRRQIGHRLEPAIDRCIANGLTELIPVKKKLGLFPPVHTRYEATELGLGELWATYRLAHITGTAILRELTKRDTRLTIRRKR